MHIPIRKKLVAMILPQKDMKKQMIRLPNRKLKLKDVH